MPHSMTAFARVEFDESFARGAWELRSVNHRYAEISIRMPDDYRVLESKVRERIANAVKRGKIDCSLRLESRRDSGETIRINDDVARSVIEAARHISALAGESTPVNPLEILRWPGVTELAEVDLDAAARSLLARLDDAIAEFVAGRQREGEKLDAMIRQRLGGISTQVEVLRDCVPSIIDNIRERHQQRMHDLAEGIDEARVEQESALLLQRLDVAEELDRLVAHVQEVEHVLQKKEPVGRKLDFLMQELNREANTLGSKSAHVDTTGAAVELKVLIEQMREQVQNIE